jgi:hypothetical protein
MSGRNLGALEKVTLFGAGAMMLIVGALHLIAPQMMMSAPAIDLTSINHYHVIRAAYGGAYLGIAALFLFGFARQELRTSSLLAVATLFSGFAFGRIISILADGVPVDLYLGVLAFEVTFAGLALAALRRRQASGSGF